MWIALLLACTAAPPPDVTFVRDGVLVPGAGEGRVVGGGRTLVPTAWKPGESQFGAVAPLRPECVGLFSVQLGDVSASIAAGAEPPDTAIAFSPDGQRVAIGAFTGEVVIADGFTGEVLARRVLPEALAKRVAWSADGSVLYVGEQSPNAALHAMEGDEEPVRQLLHQVLVGARQGLGDLKVQLDGSHDLPQDRGQQARLGRGPNVVG